MDWFITRPRPGKPGRVAAEIAATLAERSPSAIRCGLQFAANAHGRREVDATALARRFRAELFRGPDLVEGIRAFFEKREPRWPSLG